MRQANFEHVAAALGPLRAASSRTALAQAVARLVTGEAIACRVDVLDQAEGWLPSGLVSIGRAARPERRDLADADGDMGTEEARDGRAAVVADARRNLFWVVIPLVTHGALLGAIRVALEGPDSPSASDLAQLHQVASSLAIGLSSAELHEQSERVSRRLQESLLPRQLPSGDWFEVAARYVPATAGMHVGGDWYDAELLGADELAFSVGDVAGHGVEAAARMGELRSAMHAFRMLSRTPDSLIALLHRLCDPAGYFATALCARLDPVGGFRWASAGHLPPIVVRRGGGVESLAGNQSPPLGAGSDPSVLLNHCMLSSGDMVVLYTDGLIERRDERLDESVDRLSGQIVSLSSAQPRPGPSELLDALLEIRRTSGPTGDDIAAIAVHLSAPG